MRAYKKDSTTLIGEIVNAAKLVGVSEHMAELTFTIECDGTTEEEEPLVQARVTVRVIPVPGGVKDAFGNRSKLYALTATVLEVGKPHGIKYDASYQCTSQLDILEDYLAHLITVVLADKVTTASAPKLEGHFGQARVLDHDLIFNDI